MRLDARRRLLSPMSFFPDWRVAGVGVSPFSPAAVAPALCKMQFYRNFLALETASTNAYE